MKPSQALNRHRQDIRRIIAAHHVLNPRVFGSVLHGEDNENSDLDLLVEPMPKTTLFDIGAIRSELRKLLGIRVDVLTPNSLPKKFKALILSEAKPI
ncbi:nucleotidyltransferase [soil metagenome]